MLRNLNFKNIVSLGTIIIQLLGALFMLEFKAGKINKHVLYSDILNRDVTLSIYLPESYNQLVKYNVILCFDGLDFYVSGEYNVHMNR